jgi:hypothetical protein
MGMLDTLLGGDAADAARDASGQVMAGQRQAMDYLNNYYDPIRGYKSDAMGQLAGFYGIGEGDPNALYQSISGSPQFDYMQEMGAQAVGRGKSATGGLRSGGANRALASNDQMVMQNLVNQRLAGLQGFSAMNTGENDIAQIMMDMARTKGQGTTGAAQARQAGLGNLFQMGMEGAKIAYGIPPTKGA